MISQGILKTERCPSQPKLKIVIISVKVITKAKKEKVEQLRDGSYKVWVSAVPEKGRANKRVIELLAEYFQKTKQNIQIIRGKVSDRKFVEIF